MSVQRVSAFVIACDVRRCQVSTGVHPTEHEAWCEWRTDFDGMLFLAGMYDGRQDPQEYRCGKHWHISDSGYHTKGASHVTSKAA